MIGDNWDHILVKTNCQNFCLFQKLFSDFFRFFPEKSTEHIGWFYDIQESYHVELFFLLS